MYKQMAALIVVLLVLCKSNQINAQSTEWERVNKEVMSLYEQGHYDRAIVMAKKALQIAEQSAGREYYPSVATSLNNLALLYYTQGQYAQAEPLYKRSLAITEKALGPDHPIVAKSLNNIAALYESQGQYERAETLYKRALAINEKSLGHHDPEVAKSLENLADLYRKTNRVKEAEVLDKRAAAIQGRLPANDHDSLFQPANTVFQSDMGRFSLTAPCDLVCVEDSESQTVRCSCGPFRIQVNWTADETTTSLASYDSSSKGERILCFNGLPNLECRHGILHNGWCTCQSSYKS
jgi:tetratricopeptide (TPR) repeat protein